MKQPDLYMLALAAYEAIRRAQEDERNADTEPPTIQHERRPQA